MLRFNPTAVLDRLQRAAADYQTEAGPAPYMVSVRQGAFSASFAEGTANRATGAPATPDLQAEVGSQTKMMTAVIVLQLVAEGLLDLGDTAADYLDSDEISGIPNIDRATIGDLLAMRSGIPNYTDLSAPGSDRSLFVDALMENPTQPPIPVVLDLLRGLAPTMRPGTGFEYANSNYIILQRLVETVTGQSYSELLEDRIFQPAGMTRSQLNDDVPAGPGVVRQYYRENGQVTDVTDVTWPITADGGVLSTTGDMIRFLDALLVDRTLLPPEQLQAMTKNAVGGGGTLGQTAEYGYGIILVPLGDGRTALGHNGGTLATSTSSYLIPQENRFISVAVPDTAPNTDGVVLGLDQVMSGLSPDLFQARLGPGAQILRIADTSAFDTQVTLGARTDDGGTAVALGFGPLTLTLGGNAADLAAYGPVFADGSRLVTGGASGDRLSDAAGRTHDQLLGLVGDDTLRAGGGRDRLLGGAGADRLEGGRGADILTGGRGDDLLEGGDGRDVFVFARNHGADQIRDFDAAAGDRLDLTRLALSPGDLEIARGDDGTLITTGEGATILLVDTILDRATLLDAILL